MNQTLNDSNMGITKLQTFLTPPVILPIIFLIGIGLWIWIHGPVG